MPYSPQDRRALDQSLAAYVHQLGLVTHKNGGVMAIADRTFQDEVRNIPTWAQEKIPASLSAFEGIIRDGTLLCALCDRVLGLGVNSGFTSTASAGAVDQKRTDASLSSSTGRVDLSAKGAPPGPQVRTQIVN